ncbi:MAG: hypothetical protein H6740_17820 [Alphaproteobacteria bacterium]|nr:hypothetical protein [Alphaproteobacteria bacterium]
MLLALVTLLPGCLVQEVDHLFEDPDAEITRLVLSSRNGSVEVIPGDALRVSRAAEHGTLVFELTEAVEGGVATLDERCPLASQCHVDTVVELPPDVELELTLDAGSLRLEELESPMTLVLGAASVTGTGLVTPDLILEAEKADVDLHFVLPPGRLRIETQVGGVKVDLPAGAYDLEVASDLGEVTLWNLEHDPAAQGEVFVRTGAGDVALTGVGAPGS